MRTLRLDPVRNVNANLDPWDMSKESLGALGVIEGSVPHCPTRAPDGQLPAVKKVTRPVAELGRLIHNL